VLRVPCGLGEPRSLWLTGAGGNHRISGIQRTTVSRLVAACVRPLLFTHFISPISWWQS
jgi:hypothetical protein